MEKRRADDGIYGKFVYRKLVLLVVVMLFVFTDGFAVQAQNRSLAQEGSEGSGPKFTSESDAGLYVREHLKERNEQIVFRYDGNAIEGISYSSASEINGLIQSEASRIWADICNDIYEQTGKPNEGDYLRNSISSIKMNATSSATLDSGKIKISEIIYTISIKYYTNLNQEKVFEDKAISVVNGLNLSSDSEYEKVVKIYDYITNHVTYDYAHLEDDSYLIKQSAYAALIDGTSVCQGYATLFNYMANYAGLESRIVLGQSYDEQGKGGELHAWNAVKIGNLYYYVDATWDSGNYEDVYFLNGSKDLVKHIGNYMETPEGEVDPEKVIPLSAYSYYKSITKTQLNDKNTTVTVGDVTMKNGYPSAKVEVVYNGKKLLAGIDYRVEYGTYYTNLRKGTIKVVGIGLYQSTISVEYTVSSDEPKTDNAQNEKSKNDTTSTKTNNSSNSSSSKKSIKVGTKFTDGKLTYKVTKVGSTKTVTLVAAGKNLKNVKVPDSVRKDGDVFLVKAIGNNVFKNNSKLTSVVIGKNVESIGANCFSGCKKLKKITFRGTSLKKVGKNSLKKTKASITVSVPKSVKSKYVKLLKNGGISKKARYK